MKDGKLTLADLIAHEDDPFILDEPGWTDGDEYDNEDEDAWPWWIRKIPDQAEEQTNMRPLTG